MKSHSFLLLACALLLCACGKSPQRLLLGGSGWEKIVIIDKETKEIEWEHPLQKGWECNSVAATPDGNILFSYSRGAMLIDRNHEEIWNIAAPEGCEMQTARALPDGNYLLAWCGSPATVLEVSPKGEVLSKTTFDTGIEVPHMQFRQVNKNGRGNYMIPLFATSEVREISPKGELVKSVKVEGTPFCSVPLENGNELVACGDGHSFVELDFETGEIVRKVDADGIPGAKLFFVAQLWPKPDGGLYICNWQGHDKSALGGNYPQLIETDASGEIIWSLNDNQTFGMISTLCPYPGN